MLKYSLFKFRFLGFMKAFDNKTVSFLLERGGDLKIFATEISGGGKMVSRGGGGYPPSESGPAHNHLITINSEDAKKNPKNYPYFSAFAVQRFQLRSKLVHDSITCSIQLY